LPAHVSGVHVATPQMFTPPPPQFGALAGQTPHSKVPPQPSGTVPHAAACAMHVFGWQTH
jgi:hypothetical protein